MSSSRKHPAMDTIAADHDMTPASREPTLVNNHFVSGEIEVYYYGSEPQSEDIRLDTIESSEPPSIRMIGNIRGVTVSPNPYAAALFCSFPRKERWRFCKNATSEEDVQKRTLKEKAYRLAVLSEPANPDPNARERRYLPLPSGPPTMREVVSVMQHWIAAVAVTKDMVNENITAATSRRVKAWLASINKRTEEVEVLDMVTYQAYMTWVNTLPRVIEYIGWCCVGPHHLKGVNVDPKFNLPFQGMIDQVRMMNAYGRFKVAKMTFDMLAAADIRGVYKQEFLHLIMKFRGAWDQVSGHFGPTLPYAALLDPTSLSPIQGAEWEKLYTLGKLHYCRNTGASMQNFRGYNNQDVIRQSEDLLKPIKRKAGSDLITPEEMKMAKLPRIEIADEASQIERLLQAFDKSNIPSTSRDTSFLPRNMDL
nr:TPA_asm: hypothetical protein 1 [Taeniapi tapwovirus]